MVLGIRHYEAQPIQLRNWVKYQYETEKAIIKTTPHSIEIWLKGDIIGYTEADASKKAMMLLLERIIPKLEHIFRIDIIKEGHVNIEILNQHYANIENALAQSYRTQGRRLYLWFNKEIHYIVDFSHRVDEFEAVNPRHASQDYENMMAFFKPISEGAFLPPDKQQALNQKLEKGQKSILRALRVWGIVKPAKAKEAKEEPADYFG